MPHLIFRMASLAQLDRDLEKVIAELTLRLIVPRMSEFDSVWEAANRVCDRYAVRDLTAEAA